MDAGFASALRDRTATFAVSFLRPRALTQRYGLAQSVTLGEGLEQAAAVDQQDQQIPLGQEPEVMPAQESVAEQQEVGGEDSATSEDESGTSSDEEEGA